MSPYVIATITNRLVARSW